MSIDPEVIPPSSSAGHSAVRPIPRWAVYAAIALSIIVLVGILKSFLLLIFLGLLLGFIWKQNQSNETNT
tara:strand:+ start:4835 stop:5044 length:210 start_codon:yes stop_codon:yes gene_type:complete